MKFKLKIIILFMMNLLMIDYLDLEQIIEMYKIENILEKLIKTFNFYQNNLLETTIEIQNLNL